MRHLSQNIITLAMSIISISCSNDIVFENTSSSEINDLTVTVRDFQYNTSRSDFDITDRGAQFKWEANDTIGIFPDQGAQAFYTITEGTGSNIANFTGGGWALKQSSTYAAYYPFVGDFYLDPTAIPINYNGQTQIENNSTAHLGDYDFLVAKTTTPDDDNVQFEFQHIGALIQLNITCPDPSEISELILTAEEAILNTEGIIDLTEDQPQIKTLSSLNHIRLNVQEIITSSFNEQVTLYAMIPPIDLSEQELKIKIKVNGEYEEIMLAGKNFEAGKAYSLSATLKNSNIIIGNGTYQNGVVSLAEAGTMKKLLGSNYLNIESLKVVGPFNGDDVYYIKKMASSEGNLTILDLSDASIVEGGGWYAEFGREKYYTSNYSIGKEMFYGSNLSCIKLPKNLKSIETRAFEKSNLISIVIPDNVLRIGYAAFRNCASLTSVKLGSRLREIYAEAFMNCISLESIAIPNNVEEIGVEHKETYYNYNSNYTGTTFAGCTSLKSVKIGDGVQFIPESCFKECESLSKIEFGKNLKDLEGMAFYGCTSLKNIDLPNNLKVIPGGCFEGCTAIENFIIPLSVVSIGYGAFAGTSLKEINIPNNVTYLGQGAFKNCRSLSSIRLGTGISYIEPETFDACISLDSIYIPSNIKEIRASSRGGVTTGAFTNCMTLKKIIFEGDIILDAGSFITNKLFVNESGDLIHWDYRNIIIKFYGNSIWFESDGSMYPFNRTDNITLYVPDRTTKINNSPFYPHESNYKIIIMADL